MAKMTIDSVRVAVARDGTVTVPEAEDMAVGQVNARPREQAAGRPRDRRGRRGRAREDRAPQPPGRVAGGAAGARHRQGLVSRPTTVGGHDAAEVISWLRKAIRRCEEDNAIYCVVQLERSGLGAWAWKRLRVIVSEDVGLAWPEGPAVIAALHAAYVDLKRGAEAAEAAAVADAPRPRRAAAVPLAEEPPGRRRADHRLPRRRGPGGPRLGAGPPHRTGRRMRKGWADFWTEGTRLEPHAEQPGEAEWRQRAMAAVERGQALPDEESPAQGALFDP